jgi:hypothetical protein
MEMSNGDSDDGFFAGINKAEGGQLLSFAANCFQVYGFIEPFIAGGIGESGPSNQDILDAINRLAQELEVDFAQLGSLIVQQIQLVMQNEDAIALAEALAHSGTAMDHLANWLATTQDADLQFALNESDLGIQFFLALPATAQDPGQASQTQPYFLPGMAKAGTVRVLALMARDGTELWRIPADVQEISEIIALVEGMITSIEASVNAAHTVVWGPQPDSADPVIWGYFQEERGAVIEFFPAGPLVTNTAEYAQSQKLVAAALSRAEAARAAGVAAELEFLGIPHFQALVDGQWKVIITDPILEVTNGIRPPVMTMSE